MPGSPVFLVILRRPRPESVDPNEKRSDPFWEFGSFGITGCHTGNLMNPKKAKRLEGARLGFAQGGPHGTRLVYLTPPVRIATHLNCIEVTWTPNEMPFRYLEAPKLAHNRDASDFPLLESTFKGGKRKTPEGQFASQFRSRATPLEVEIAEELISVYSTVRSEASGAAIAAYYTDALPQLPPLADQDRHQTYLSLLEAAKTKSSEQELVTAYVANCKRNRALSLELARAEVVVSDGRTCTPRT